ncbi:ester cyclase [Streptomyces sp. Ru71]|uniref:ester cyclase n=1 Tax=Streptomyces sp. Ru71 TaxID=2080746 RepID=UPI000CDDC599|nr:ester cyclase [Streptomyces sp. Ru71]POX54779.1 ester cyclase [Streptomyces sp. Ru71]
MSDTSAFSRMHEAVNSGDLELVEKTIDEVVDPGLVFHAPVPTGVSGVQALKQVWRVLLTAFPDLRVEIEDVVTQGDKAVYRNTVTGTHLGEYRGLAPTGRSVRYAEMFIVRLAGGRIAEIWGVVDVLAQLRQLGAVDV